MRLSLNYVTRLFLFSRYLLLCSCLYLFLGSCTIQENLIEQSPARFPIYLDDAPRQSLLTAIGHHINYLRSIPATTVMVIGKHSFSAAVLVDSLSFFKTIIEKNPDPLELGQLIRQHFHVFEAAGRNEAGEMLVTGYYEPLFEGSLSKTPPYIYPLHGIPESLISRKNGKTGIQELGRLDQDGTITPYWTRDEIETQGIAKDNELVYLKDPLDAYLLHVQG